MIIFNKFLQDLKRFNKIQEDVTILKVLKTLASFYKF